MSTPFSNELAPRDHARLAQRLADDIGRLREARLQHGEIQQAQDGLNAFLGNDLIPYLRAEEAELYAASTGSQPSGRFGSGKKRRLSRRLREHREVIGAADALHSVSTPLQALNDAEHVASLFNAHLVEEDRELLAAPRPQANDGSVPTLTAALATALDAVLAHDHARIAHAVTLARHAPADDPANKVGACDRAVAALSQHAAVMSTVAYPMARLLLPRPERAPLRSLTADLRQAEQAMRHLNRLLRGAARENPRYEEQMWQVVERAWRRHVADEEPLLRRLAPLLPPERAVSLMASLRRPFRHSLTRPHPALLHAGWPTRLAIRAQYRIDRWRDVLDNRSS